jgi:multiple sugar transport system substrate-binding protein
VNRARLALAALLALVPAGCGRPTPRVTEVAFWDYAPESAVLPLVRAFEREHPGIRVALKTLSHDGGGDTLAAALAAGRPPDLCQLGSDDMPAFLASGVLSDWSAGVADLRDSLRGWPMCMVGDAIYGLPWTLDARALFFNRSLLARAGLDPSRPPATWDQLYAAAARVQALGHGVHGMGVVADTGQALIETFLPFAWGNDGEILSARLDSSRFDSPENVAALAFYLRLRRAGALAPRDSLEREFARGRLGLLVTGAWVLGGTGARPGPDVGVALVPRPAADRGEHASFAGGEMLASFTRSRHKEDGLRLARFLVRPENLRTLTGAWQELQPATAGADTLEFYRSRPDQQVLVRQLAEAHFPPHHPRWGEMRRAITDEVGEALADRKTAARAIADADARIADLAGRQ